MNAPKAAAILLIALLLGRTAIAEPTALPPTPDASTAAEALATTDAGGLSLVYKPATPTPEQTAAQDATAPYERPSTQPSATPTVSPNDQTIVIDLSQCSLQDIRLLQMKLFSWGFYGDLKAYSKREMLERLTSIQSGLIDQPTKDAVQAFQMSLKQRSARPDEVFVSPDGFVSADQLDLLASDAPSAILSAMFLPQPTWVATVTPPPTPTPTPSPAPTPTPTPIPLTISSYEQAYSQPMALLLQGQPGAKLDVRLRCGEWIAEDTVTISSQGNARYPVPPEFLRMADGQGVITVIFAMADSAMRNATASFLYQTQPRGNVSLSSLTFGQRGHRLILKGQLTGNGEYGIAAKVALYSLSDQTAPITYVTTDARRRFTIDTGLDTASFNASAYALVIDNDVRHPLSLVSDDPVIEHMTLFPFMAGLSVMELLITAVALLLLGAALLLTALLSARHGSTGVHKAVSRGGKTNG